MNKRRKIFMDGLLAVCIVKMTVVSMIKQMGRTLAGSNTGKTKGCKASPTFRAKGHEKAFTRDRKLTAERIVSMILQPAKQSLTTRLYKFGVKYMGGNYATKQAFSKQRQFVNPEYIREFFDENAEEILLNGELITFKGKHLTAVDGTRIAFENTPDLIEGFGCSGSKKDSCTALASVVYDLIERVAFDCQIGNYSLSERELLNKHLDRLENFSGKTRNAVLQEFYATMTRANICQCFINDADAEIAAKDKLKGYKYPRQANRRQCVGRIVPVFLEAVFTDNERKRDRLWKEVEDFCEKFSEPVRPGRNPKRKTPRDRKFYPNARKPRLS